MKRIPVDLLQNKTNAGLQIKAFRTGDEGKNEAENTGAHRDDHYIFFLLTKGSGSLSVDLHDVVVNAAQLFYILPSQVHYKIKTDNAEGWFLAVDASLIPPNLKQVFEVILHTQVPCTLTVYELKQYEKLLSLLHDEFTDRRHGNYYLPVIHTLVQSFLAMAASAYDKLENVKDKPARPAQLLQQFKTLLAAHCRTNKSPSAYASMLNVSPGYLNETVKKVTGSTVSYWIQHAMFSEAKRWLYYSDNDVKQIAMQLGYSDYSYFARTFRKMAGLSPAAFRELNRQ